MFLRAFMVSASIGQNANSDLNVPRYNVQDRDRNVVIQEHFTTIERIAALAKDHPLVSGVELHKISNMTENTTTKQVWSSQTGSPESVRLDIDP